MKRSYSVDLVLEHYPNLKFDEVVSRLRSTYVSIPRRYMYCAVSKAGNTTMKEILHSVEHFPPIKSVGHSPMFSRRDMFLHWRENVPLPSLADLDNKTQKQVLESPDFLRITVVRNPYTRLASAWRNRVLVCEPPHVPFYRQVKGQLPELGKKSLILFEEFVDHIANKCDLSTCNQHWRRQADQLFIKALRYDHIGKVERMEETVKRFQEHLGISKPLALGRKNSTFAGTVRFTQALADQIYSLYKEDFVAFGYDRNDWPHDGNHARSDGTVPEELFIDEIIERNIIIYQLYQERNRLMEKTPSVLRGLFNKFQRTLLGQS